MKSSFIAAVMLFAVSILLLCVNNIEKENTENVTRSQLAGQFLHYSSALNDLYGGGTPPDGDVINRISLPDWLPRTAAIQMRVSGGTGYTFTPSYPGLLAQVLQETENSTHFGLTDAAGINTPAGRLSRPAFIPAGYVVYVR